MKVAITGANGFLGSYIVKAFLEEGYQVIGLVRKSSNCDLLPNHSSLTLEYIDYHSELPAQFESLEAKHGELTFFIHNAGVTVSLDNDEYFRINVGLTEKIINALSESTWLPKKEKLIYVSSMAANGPIHINTPVSNYGQSKLDSEKVIANSGYPFLMLRPTGIYGAGDVAFLPLFKLAARGLYPLTNAAQKMSMIHAKDLANIIVKEADRSTGILHANDGNTYLHQDFMEALQEVTGKKIRKMPTPKWISKLSLGLSDIWHKIINKRPGLTLEKFQEISMDWHLHEDPKIEFSKIPSKISLKDGFRDAFDFYKKNQLL